MEFVKSSNQVNAIPPSNTQAQAIVGSEANKSTSIPVQIELTSSPHSILLSGTQYNLQLQSAELAKLATAMRYSLSLTPGLENVKAGQQTQLFALAADVIVPVPTQLSQLAKTNGIDSVQLLSLASRAQGYPLPKAEIRSNILHLSASVRIEMPPQPTLSDGEYLPSLRVQANKLVLVLAPILTKVDVTLSQPNSSTAPATLPQTIPKAQVHHKPELGQIYAAMLKKLEQITVSTVQGKASAILPASSEIEVKELSGAVKAIDKAAPLLQPQAMSQKHAQPSTVPGSSAQLIRAAQSSLLSQDTASPQGALKETVGVGSDTGVKQAMTVPSQQPQSSSPQNTQLQGNQIQNLHSLETHPKKSEPSHPDAQQLKHATQSPLLTTARQTNNLQTSNSTLDKPPVDLLFSSSTKSPLPANTEPQPNKASITNALEKALLKAGTISLPAKTLQQNRDNLATILLKYLPHIAPSPLGELAEPTKLAQEMAALTGLNLAATQSQSNPLTLNATAITTLFQLLLGFKMSAQGKLSGAGLQTYLQELQLKIGLSREHLQMLTKAGVADSVSQLASGLSLYQQASLENTNQLSWFFALPYNLGQRHEQIEGHFEREQEDKQVHKNNNWRLQLKFNLASGPILIKAHHHNEQLDIQFKANSQALLTRVSNFFPPLIQKLSQIGFVPGELSTQIDHIPATLLPGDHYLVKIEA